MIAMPDPSSMQLIPWREEETNRTARMFCDIQVPGGDPYEGDRAGSCAVPSSGPRPWASTTTTSAPSSSTSTSARRSQSQARRRCWTRAATST
jgi:hypothetical protein